MRLTGDEDRRGRRTISSLKKAYIELLEEKDTHRITVTELADRAMLNKKTFYSYYASLEELQNEMVEESIDKFEEQIRDYDINDFKSITQAFFDYFSDKKIFLLKVLTQKGAEYFYTKTEEATARENDKDGFMRAAALDVEHRHVVFCFLINSLIMMFAKWNAEGRTIPVDEAVDMTAELLEHGAGSYLNKA